MSSHHYLPKPRRSSRSVPSSSSTKEQQQPVSRLPSYAADSPYTPFLQPKGAYAYKIALPSRPQPGQTPWPGQLPPVVGPAAAALGEATNRPRHSSHHGHVRTTSMSAPAPAQVTGPLVARPHVSRSTSMMARVPAPAPQQALQPVPAHSTGQQQVWANGLNPLLGPGGGLLWTLRSPVSYIKTRTSSLATPGPLTYAHRALPIQSSRTPIIVVIPLPGAPIRIQVETVGALVDMLSDVLRVQANAVQWAAADQRSVTTAYRARCGADAAELAKGVRRVDLLGLNAAFAGLVPVMSPTGAREWVLRVVVMA